MIEDVDTEPTSAAVPAGTTGNAHVDDVLASITTLPELPVDQHVAVFEAAHAGLRQALSDPTPGPDAQG